MVSMPRVIWRAAKMSQSIRTAGNRETARSPLCEPCGPWQNPAVDELGRMPYRTLAAHRIGHRVIVRANTAAGRHLAVRISTAMIRDEKCGLASGRVKKIANG
jgi:hypothetical protein